MKIWRGFSLLEVLISLAILAVVLGATTRIMATVTDHVRLLEEKTLASWVAQDRLVVRQRIDRLPKNVSGTYSGQAQQANLIFRWQETVQSMPNTTNTRLRKIDIRVTNVNQSDYVLAQVSGYIFEP